MPLRVRVSCTWDATPHHLEATTRDYISCPYDDRTLANIFNKLYSYARTISYPAKRPRLRLARSSPYQADDIEMLTSSPSPTLHASTSTSSPRSLYSQTSHNGSYRYPNTSSPRPYIRRPPAAAFPGRSSPTIAPSRSSLSTSTHSSKTTVDAGTQYTPPLDAAKKTTPSSSSLGKRQNSSSPPSMSPTIPPEPALAPQLPQKRTTTTSPPRPPNATTSSFPKPKPTTPPKPNPKPASPTTSPSTSTSTSPKRPRPNPHTTKPMPLAYETCDTADLVKIISAMLMELIRLNDAIPLKDGGLTRFHSRAPPTISVADYLQRLTTHATLSPPILLSMVYYIDRLCALYPSFTISSLTVHRFLITAATVASKGLSDSFWTNSLYARVGGITLKELALLELEFLWRVEWRIVPRPEVLVDYYKSLVERSEGFRIAGGGKRRRGRRKGTDSSAGSSGGSEGSGEGGSVEGRSVEMEVEGGGEKGKADERGA